MVTFPFQLPSTAFIAAIALSIADGAYPDPEERKAQMTRLISAYGQAIAGVASAALQTAMQGVEPAP